MIIQRTGVGEREFYGATSHVPRRGVLGDHRPVDHVSMRGMRVTVGITPPHPFCEDARRDGFEACDLPPHRSPLVEQRGARIGGAGGG